MEKELDTGRMGMTLALSEATPERMRRIKRIQKDFLIHRQPQPKAIAAGAASRQTPGRTTS